MNTQQLLKLMKEKPYLLDMGKGLLSKRYNITPEGVVEAKRLYRNKIEKPVAKILIFDIETSPMRAFIWNMWNNNTNLEQVISEWYCIAWSAKWLYSNDVMGDVLTPEEAIKEDDSRIVKSLWELFNQADIVVAHNGNKFDIPKMNARFIINDLPPTKPYFSIDTCLIARKQFGFSSNKLDALAGYFNIPHKLETSFDLWKKCMEGDKESLEYMLEYNKKDVIILEEVYLKLRPWIKNHPNIGNLEGIKVACANCGSESLEKTNNFYYTSVGKYKLYKCKCCGALSRSRKKELTSTELISVGK